MNNPDLLEKVITIDERSKNNSSRINKIDEEMQDINDIVISIKEIAIEIKYMRQDMNDVIKRIKDLENIPRNRWNDIIKTILTVTVTAITTFVLIKLGIK